MSNKLIVPKSKTQRFLYKFVGSYQLFTIAVLVRKDLGLSYKEIYAKLKAKDSHMIDQVKQVLKKKKSLRWAAACFFTANDLFIQTLFIFALKSLLSKLDQSPSFQQKLEEIREKLKEPIKNEFLKCYIDFLFSYNQKFKFYEFELALIVGAISLTEEGSKYISNMFGFLKEYVTIFNIYEFSMYSAMILKDYKDYKKLTLDILNFVRKRNLLNIEESYQELLITSIYKVLSSYARNVVKQNIEDIQVNTTTLKEYVKWLKRLHKTKVLESHAVTGIIMRVVAVIAHIILAYLHKKNKTLAAVVSHAIYNTVIASLIMAYMSCKTSKIVLGKKK